MSGTEKLVSIVVPVFNEGENIGECLNRIRATIQNLSHEILICYDFDEDNTLPAIEAMPEKPAQLRLVKNTIGPGPANAIRAGIQAARGDIVITMMADLSDDPDAIPEMVKKIRDEGCAVVSGSRYMAGGCQIGGPRVKRLLSRQAGYLLNLIGLNTKDPTTNYRAYQVDFLKTITIESTKGFEIGLELTVKAFMAGRKIGEVPTTWHDRSAGKSNFKILNWMPYYLNWFGKAVLTSVKKNLLFSILSLLFALTAVFIVCTSIYSILSWPNVVYHWDHWGLTNVIDGYMQHKLTFRDLISQHNEHRILFLKLFYLVDVLLFSGKNWLFLGLIIINQLVIAIALCCISIDRERDRNIFSSLWFYSLIFICTFTGLQFQNLFWPFQVAYLGAQSGLVVSLLFLKKAIDHQSKSSQFIFILLAVAAAVYASFSLASGVLVFLLLIAISLYRRIDFKLLIVLILATVLVYVIYFYHYSFPAHHSNPFNIFHDLNKIMLYFICYIGSPFQYLGGGGGLKVPTIMGVFGLFFYFLYLFNYILKYERMRAVNIVFIAIATYVLLSAVITSSGRIKFGVSQALTSRYISISILFWISLIYLYFVDLDNYRTGQSWWMSAFIIFILVFFFSISANHLNLIENYKMTLTKRDVIGKKILLGLASEDDYKKIYPHTNKLKQKINILKKYRLGIYATELSENLRKYENFYFSPCIGNDQKWAVNKNFDSNDVSPSTTYQNLSRLTNNIMDISLYGSYKYSTSDAKIAQLVSLPFKAEHKVIVFCTAGYPLSNQVSINNIQAKDRMLIEETLGRPGNKWEITPIILPDYWEADDDLQLEVIGHFNEPESWMGISEPLNIKMADATALNNAESDNCTNLLAWFYDKNKIKAKGCRLIRHADYMAIESESRDPQLSIPGINLTAGGIKCLNVKIDTPDITTFEVFYLTKEKQVFHGTNSIRVPLKKGGNSLSIVLPPVSEGMLRIDPGTKPGTYTIRELFLCP